MSKTGFNRFASNWVIWGIGLSLLYLLWFGFVVGMDSMAVGFYILALILYFSSGYTRQLGIAFMPLFIYLICYSSLKILHDYNPFTILNKVLYDWELKLFGIESEGTKITLCEYANQHIHPALDVISGSFYITWAPFPILFGLYAFIKKRRKLVFDFWICFLIANILGFIIYIVLPAAPPWYYLQYGEQLLTNAPGEAAGLARFDAMVGIPIYHNMYSQGTNTFGALPSMHAAFPLILSFYSLRYGNKLLSGLFIISLISIWFAAIYTNHHYLIDVLMGIGCGIIGIFLTETWVNGSRSPAWYQRAMAYIC